MWLWIVDLEDFGVMEWALAQFPCFLDEYPAWKGRRDWPCAKGGMDGVWRCFKHEYTFIWCLTLLLKRILNYCIHQCATACSDAYLNDFAYSNDFTSKQTHSFSAWWVKTEWHFRSLWKEQTFSLSNSIKQKVAKGARVSVYIFDWSCGDKRLLGWRGASFSCCYVTEIFLVRVLSTKPSKSLKLSTSL